MSDLNDILKNRKFILLWSSQLLSQLTIQVMNFLILVRLFEQTGSTIATSFIWIAYALPAILIGPFAAAWVDLVDKRMVLVLTNLLQALSILFYAFFANRFLFLSYAVVLMYSFFNQFYVPAEAATLPLVVKKEKLPQANGLFFLTQQAAIIVGFGLAGVLSDIIGYRFSFFLASLLLFWAFINVSLLPNFPVKGPKIKGLELQIFDFFQKVDEGYKFIRKNYDILMPFSLLIGLHTAVSIVSISLPIMATDLLNVKPSLSGLFVVIPAGIGAGLGTLIVSKRLKEKFRKKVIVERSLMMLALSTWLAVFLIPEFVPGLRPFIGAAMFFLIGMAYVGIFIPSQTYLQEETPNHMMGRLFGYFWFLATIATIFPVLFSATVIEVFGVKLLFFLMGFAALATYIFSSKKGQALLANKNGKEI